MDKGSVLRGLLARLELDSDLGLDYVSGKKNVISHLEEIARGGGGDLSGGVLSTGVVGGVGAAKKSEKSGASGVVSSVLADTGEGGGAVSVRRGPTRVSLVPYVSPPSHPEREELLEGLRVECMECRACGLCERRNSVVWGEGNLAARVMFIGEGPGRDEDLEGRPFVGPSGRLLTDIIEKGMRVSRSEVYIANVVKCRPPGNRDPEVGEVVACSRYLSRQIEVIGPRVIVAVGSVAGRTLLGREGSGALRGVWHQYNGIPMRVIYHPSYLLRMRRSESDRTVADRATWGDIQEVMARVGE